MACLTSGQRGALPGEAPAHPATQRPDAPADTGLPPGGPGWYESSWELHRGLLVHEEPTTVETRLPWQPP